MANPVGQDSWLAYVEEETRRATDLEGRVKVVELFKSACSSEPASLKIWLAYCEYFWSLFTDSQSSDAGWPEEEQQLGREIFSFDSALSLWSEGYDAVKYRINDSHEFWNRWVSIEQEQLARTRTPAGVQRISHLFRDRLQLPHAAWENTSQLFSSFLSEYNNTAYESEFKEVTASAQEAKDAYELREPWELKLNRAAKSGDDKLYKSTMLEYLDWEMVQTKKSLHKNHSLAVALCVGLYSRALTDVCALDDTMWCNYAVYLSTAQYQAQTAKSTSPPSMPNMLDILQRAVAHCPWSGTLWARYILSAEEAGWAFQNIESIKHAATNTKELDRDGMTGVLDMYAAWCGYLKRTAMDPNATEDSVDLADVGLLSALEDVQLWGKRLYRDAYKGDPNYRLQRILIQYLTEKDGAIEEARDQWERMAKEQLWADSYDFWLNYYLWEMMIFAQTPKLRSPTPATPVAGPKPIRVPSFATDVLMRAIERHTIDWPERIMEVFLQHSNDYERPETVHHALDMVHKARKGIAKRRERERAEAVAAYAAQTAAGQTAAEEPVVDTDMEDASSSNSKRKRDDEEADPNKRSKSNHVNGVSQGVEEQQLKRDRENTSILVSNLPADATLTAVRKYFKDYGHINSATVEKAADGTTAAALIEFASTDDVQSALLRDQKYFGSSQISVAPGTGLTIYVTNYPPEADETYIRGLFEECGEIFSIRWPSLKYNTHRRFCYVSFRTPEASAKATELDGKRIEGKYRLVAKYSNPSNKKSREGAVAEGRELRVKDFQPQTSEDDLRAIFTKYGNLQSLRILKKIGGQVIPTAFVVFETKEEAEKALELDKTKMKSAIISVELSKETNFKPFATARGGSVQPSNASSPAGSTDAVDVPMSGQQPDEPIKAPTSAEIQARTIALLNIPDTVNDARVRSIVEKHGDIVKVVLRPDHQGAIVEFADAMTVGRASLALEGFEIAPGRKIRVGTVKELFGTKSETKTDTKVNVTKKAAFMPPPQTVRRPAALGQHKGGPKRGLGFVPVKKASATHGEGPANGPAVNGTGANKPKSNAEFKAMFLNGTKGPDAGAQSAANGDRVDS